MEDVRRPIQQGSNRFMDRFRLFIRARQLAIKTEKTYCYWVLHYIRFNNKKNPGELGAAEVEAFLEYLANTKNVSPNTQKTALNAIVFLYHKFLQKDLGTLKYTYSTKPWQLPTVFTHQEATKVIEQLKGTQRLAASLMYGSGLRVSETTRLRIQDIELNRDCIVVREAKGLKSRQRNIQEILGHNDISTTQIYTHVVGLHRRGMRSPVDS